MTPVNAQEFDAKSAAAIMLCNAWLAGVISCAGFTAHFNALVTPAYEYYRIYELSRRSEHTILSEPDQRIADRISSHLMQAFGAVAAVESAIRDLESLGLAQSATPMDRALSFARHAHDLDLLATLPI